ncbi:NADP-dependent phosphogluconate dehydrogenase [Planctomycetota bacterium]
MTKADIGLWGLAVMGQNLVLNMESKGFTVAVYNRTAEKTRQFITEHAADKKIRPAYEVKDFTEVLARPRKVMIMVKAGAAVDKVIDQLIPFLEKGDVIIDGGNSFYKDTIRRYRALEDKGLHYIGTGVSGGEEGALKGPSIMPGGSKGAYNLIKPIFTKISAQVQGQPCCAYIGGDGAGHFVKMVHNGIEYGDMQLICEAYALMGNALGMSAAEMSEVFGRWNKGDLNSYLIEITADILSKTDAETGQPMVEVILDKAGQKGTGMWTSQAALELGITAPTIVEAVFARFISALKNERVAASKELTGPDRSYNGDKAPLVEAIHNALYASKVCSYAQGFALMAQAGREYNWNLNFGAIAMIWRGGCIIRAHFLERIKEAFEQQPNRANLLPAPYFKSIIEKTQSNWRRVVIAATELGIAVPAFSSALNYYDSYRSARLPANLLQAQRDYFGAHTYERIDQKGSFHTDWQGI